VSSLNVKMSSRVSGKDLQLIGRAIATSWHAHGKMHDDANTQLKNKVPRVLLLHVTPFEKKQLHCFCFFFASTHIPISANIVWQASC